MSAEILGDLVKERDGNLTFIEELQAEVRSAGRADLNDSEMEQITRRKNRNVELTKQIDVLKGSLQQRSAATAELEEINQLLAGREQRGGQQGAVEYRTVGQFITDRNRAYQGDAAAAVRLEAYKARAVQHQKTEDNPGLLPEKLVGPIIAAIDAVRPLVAAFGVTSLDSLNSSRPKVTQHTQVDKQAGEKTELASRKMTISKLPIDSDTYGGYLNVSLQNQAFTQPNIMDIVIADMGEQYAIETEEAGALALIAAGTAGITLPANPTAAQVAAALWSAAGLVYAAVKGRGRLVVGVSPDMLGLVGPLFAPVNPQNAQSSGFNAGGFGQGAVGAISQISVIMSAGYPAGTLQVASTAAMEFREHRYGVLQATEPSVLGTQVAVAGEFASTPIFDEEGGIQNVAVA